MEIWLNEVYDSWFTDKRAKGDSQEKVSRIEVVWMFKQRRKKDSIPQRERSAAE